MLPYPTPTSQDHSRNTIPPSIGKTRGMDLSMRVLADRKIMLPTPTLQDSRIGMNNIGGNKHRVKRGSEALADKILFPTPEPGGKLNSLFVEFLMGFPMNWTKIEPTELKVLETQSYHKSQQKSAKQSSKQRNKNDR